MTEPEFSRPVRLRQIDASPLALEANEDERAALAERFAIPEVETLSAQITLERDGDRVKLRGTMDAAIQQDCAVSGEPFRVEIVEPVTLVFVPAEVGLVPNEEVEIELEREELDEIEYQGETIDVGEAIAQSLALAIDPYAEGPEADRVRQEKGIEAEGTQNGPLADMLAALKKD